jgi:hypothetical protein
MRTNKHHEAQLRAYRKYDASLKGKARRQGHMVRRKKRLKHMYGITLEQYEDLLAAQDGHCAVCPKRPQDTRWEVLTVDHDHDTGKVRGLLCTRHNFAIAALGDNTAGLKRALKYVSKKGKGP